jgi:integrase
MEKKQRQNCCQLKIYPNEGKISKKTGLLPFYVKLTFQKKKVEFRLFDHYDVKSDTLKFWDDKTESLNKSGSSCEDLNIKIDEIKLNFKRYMRENNNTPKHSLNEIMYQILGIQKVNINQTILNFMENHYNQVIINLNDISIGTKTNYKKSINHFKKFSTVHNQMNMLLTEFQYTDARKFQIWMGSVDGANNLPSSASGIIKNLKHILAEAHKCDLISKNPFDKLKLNHKCSSHTPYLSIDQLKKIVDNELGSKNNNLAFYKDLFIFSCYTGLSVCDVQSLSKDVLMPVFDGRIKIDTTRQKTDRGIIQILPLKAQEIIEKYIGLSRLTIFPKFCPYTYNKKVKLLGAFSGLGINLTTKIARTTCHQMLINVRYIDDMYKRKYMGWSNNSDIRTYYTTIEDAVLMANTNLIDKYLNENVYN